MNIKAVKMCDMELGIALRVLKLLNPAFVNVLDTYEHNVEVFVYTDPKNLIYPEGWYCENNTFKNRPENGKSKSIPFIIII